MKTHGVTHGVYTVFWWRTCAKTEGSDPITPEAHCSPQLGSGAHTHTKTAALTHSHMTLYTHMSTARFKATLIELVSPEASPLWRPLAVPFSVVKPKQYFPK